MNKIGGYGVYQSSYYENTVNSRKEKESVRKTKSAETEKTAKKEKVQLSERAKKLLEELKKKYSNMDFMVADYDSEEEAASYLSRGMKEYSVLIDAEELEEMAADEQVKNKQLGVLEDAVSQLADMKNRLGDKADEVTHLGVAIGKDGSVSYFAELEKVSTKQRERIEKAREEKKEEAAKAKENTKEEGVQGRTKKLKVKADTVEELLEKIQSVDWDSIKEEEKEKSGSRFDFSI